MFIEDNDWNEDQASPTPSKPILNKTVGTSNGTIKLKAKGVGKKSLLRTLKTLKTLGSAPEPNRDVQKDSDSEAESAPAAPRPKRKKKRNRGKKKSDAAGTETAGTEPAGLDDDKKKADNVPKVIKKKDGKMGPRKLKKTDPGSEKSKVMPEKKEDNELNRKQWKVKMKNRRKCKNKYREKELEECKADTATESATGERHKVDTHSSNHGKETLVKTSSQIKAKQKDPKPQKRKLTEPADGLPNTTDIHTLEQNKKPVKNKKVKESKPVEAIGSPGLEPNKKADKAPVEVQLEVNVTQPVAPSDKKKETQKLQEESRKREKLRKILQPDEPERHTENQDAEEEEEESTAIKETASSSAPMDRSASLRARMEQRLEAARFRYINEVLYTSTSGEAKRMFSQDPQAFGVYHRGFTAQVQRWPANPVDAIIAFIHKKPASHVVADFGCGDCKIALSVKNKVHSFDLAPICKLVTVCDMAKVPLKDCSVHIAVFCLSLMGTNLIDFLTEANRVLVMGGVLKVAEVASRFGDIRGFLSTLSSLGFKMALKDTENSHFYSFEFVKTKDVSETVKSSSLELRPCVYKRR